VQRTHTVITTLSLSHSPSAHVRVFNLAFNTLKGEHATVLCYVPI
jgi:hypothetical protein